MISFSEDDVREAFDDQTFARGWHYQKTGRVSQLSVSFLSKDECLVEGEVQGSRRSPYQVSVEITNDSHGIVMLGECSCPVELDCKHAAAILLEAIKGNPIKNQPILDGKIVEEQWLKDLSKKNLPSNDHSFSNWLVSLDKSDQNISIHEGLLSKDFTHHLLYVLTLEPKLKLPVVLSLIIAKPLKKGGYGAQKPFSPDLGSHYSALLPSDHEVLHKLEVIDRSQGIVDSSVYKSEYTLLSNEAPNILEEVLKTKRCYWKTEADFFHLTLGEVKKGSLEWSMGDLGEQQLICKVEQEQVTVLPIQPAWYIRPSKGTCGPLETGLDPKLFGSLLFAPPLLPMEVEGACTLIKKRFKTTESFLPMPQMFNTMKSAAVKPRPKLLLLGIEPSYLFFNRDYFDRDNSVAVGRVSFMYNKMEVQMDAPEHLYLLDKDNNLLRNIDRKFSLEKDHLNLLLQKGISFFPKRSEHLLSDQLKPQDFLIGRAGQRKFQEDFLYHTVPELKTLGWTVVVDPSFPVEYLLSIDDWYSEIHETSEYGWFNMEMGFVLGEQKINILPLLVNLIQEKPAEFTEQHLNANAAKNYIFSLPDGQKVQIPSERIKGILATLAELYDEKSLNPKGQLSVSRLRARQLLEIEKAMQVTQMRWLGGEQLQQLNQKLADFKAIKPVKISNQFKGELRDYQKQGINWLGFLREYQLGGILSDDMGLGKTVQTLAHILVEKEQKRLNGPCLVVAPTSLMSNWKNESKQFTPSLKVVILQGQFRKQGFDKIQNSDIVLTTYPLLVRDKEILLKNEYEIIVLDEAQYIKNAKTNAYQVLQQLHAKHRICLTGTPMENHLGELWSLFNFLSPGLLGNSKQFYRIFRVPIEKQGNIIRQQSLNQRIYPYILRRTKDQVLKELPPKTEVVCPIELPDLQRDLYEGIRLSVEKKLKRVINERGLANSQIIILDALLKLRQVCCDPRLLSLEQAQKVKTSAKLDFLIKMLIPLIQAGRKILVFSSFASMLKLIEEELLKQRISYVKLTGSTKDREGPIQQFQAGKAAVFLISLKAGGTGLNLTVADTVIHYDPWWNPAVEAQATDRAHRIGQTKSIFVYKLVTSGTVEEKILSMQQKKKALLDGLFGEGQKGNKMGITQEDLNFLFKPIELTENLEIEAMSA